MLRHILTLRTPPEPARPARDVIIDARRHARRDLLRPRDQRTRSDLPTGPGRAGWAPTSGSISCSTRPISS
jgi:hypothetical protein